MLQESIFGDETELLEEKKGQFGANFIGSFGFHIAIIAALGLSMWAHFRHGNNWGQDNGIQGAIQASLVSSAPSVPLPSDTPPTKNVLATETPSAAPAIPEKAANAAPDLKAVAIPTKQPEKTKPVPPKPQQQEQKHPQQPPDQHRANYGEQQAPNLPRSMASAPNANSPVAVSGGDFGSRFGWYVNGITRKVSENWYKQSIDPSTPQGAQTVIIFRIGRDGSADNVRIGKSSGSYGMDTECVRAVQRAENFGPLPPAYNGSTVDVAYTFTYQEAGH
jgi:protein TonB